MEAEAAIENSETTSTRLGCSGCGAILKFSPGASSLKCDYCGSSTGVTPETVQPVGIPFVRFLKESFREDEMMQLTTVKCTGCGAESTLDANITADSCSFCNTTLIAENKSSSKVLKPEYVLPFKVESKAALEAYRKWISKLWFAPGDLKKFADSNDKLSGVYIPYWSYDTKTRSNYTGSRGDDYYDTEYVTDDKGRMKKERVKKTSWTAVSGTYRGTFDDLLVVATKSLPEKYTDNLEPWDLSNLSRFDKKFISGFKAECYQVDVKEGYETAKSKMDTIIREKVKKSIGGDHQKINSIETFYEQIYFNHILLPVWVSAYRYNSKVYRFMINGRTGEVQGERPYSWIKIGLLVILFLALIAAGIYMVER